MAPLLAVSNLCVSTKGKEIVRGASLVISPGEVHALMGPNGSGKSTIVHALMGHPAYTVTAGSASFCGENLLTLAPHERARRGLFLAFQYPREIAGVSLQSFLFASYQAVHGNSAGGGKRVSPLSFKRLLERAMEKLRMNPAMAERSVNHGFSGGEKKKAEVLQLSVLRPRLALLDETDSGLDIDALKVVAEGVNALRSPSFSALIVTHYARILEYITPDRVHVMVQGRIVESGGKGLAQRLEKEGYKKYGSRAAVA